MSFISYAQNYEDVMLWRALKHIKCGFYVDVGAQDPVKESVTKLFYDNGWRGINIEPVNANFQKFQKLRSDDINLNVAVGSSIDIVEFYEIVDTGLSTINFDFAKRHLQDHEYKLKQYAVEVQPLTKILEQFAKLEIHFLKIDVEGSELSTLQGLNLSKFRPWIIVIESTLPNTQYESHDAWEHLITDSNYHYVYFDGLNRFYVSNEHSELDTSFNTPPNFWDAFKTFEEYNLAIEVQQLNLDLKKVRHQHQLELEQLELALQESQQQRERLELLLKESQQWERLELLLKESQQREHLELLLKESQQQRERLELLLKKSQQQRECLELLFKESQQQLEQVQVVLQTLLNSRSMRLTLPLRLAAHHARSLKQRIKESLGVPKLWVKQSSKKVLINLAYQLSGKPQLKFIALNLLRYSPNLKHRLKLLTLTSSSSHAKDLEPTHISTLSPHAARIFYDLKEAIREAHRSGINSVKSKK